MGIKLIRDRLAFGVLILLVLILSKAEAQHKKMPKLKNPSGQGFIPCGSCEQPSEISSETIISLNEEGERLTISGVVFEADGKTPAAGITLFFYHTDSKGHYNNEDDPNDPRLKGWVKTDSKGHYKFSTIKPAPYPSLKTPAHIHVHRFSKDYSEKWIEDYWFQGDKLINDSDIRKYSGLGDFSPIVALKRDKDGTLIGKRNIIFK